MAYMYCSFCRAYTPVDGSRCTVCGMDGNTFMPLSKAVEDVRTYPESCAEPIRIRPEKGRTIRLHDARSSKPIFAKLTDSRGRGEYMIVDSGYLRSIIGELEPVGRNIANGTGKLDSETYTVSYTRNPDMIGSLNRRPRKKTSKRKGRRA